MSNWIATEVTKLKALFHSRVTALEGELAEVKARLEALEQGRAKKTPPTAP
jgi:hypothetical protein